VATPELSIAEVAEIQRLEEAMWREETRFDRAFQEAHFAADFVEFGRSGRIYRREDIIQTDSHGIEATLPLPDFAVRVLNPGTVLVTYNSAVAYGGRTEYARRSSIWSRSSSGWVMRFHQGTPYEP
jgi:hypothetical protein